ncbi:MAG: hypothetical protein AAFQ80_12185 [Cyanobacteria bacterium J06621_8]
MEIIAQTSRRLELGYRQDNSLLGVVALTLVGLGFLGFGVWGIFSGRQKILKCARIEPELVECQIKSSGIIGSQTTKLSGVEKAEIITRKKTNVNNRLRKDTYGVVILGSGQKISISVVSTSNRNAKQADVRRINSFINNPRQFTLTMEEDGRWLGFIIGSILIAVGSVVIYAMWQMTLIIGAVFDKTLGILRIQKRSLYGKTEKRSWNLQEVEEIFLERSKGKNSNMYSVNLKLHSQLKCLTLLRTENSLAAETIANNVRKFLN